jgi:hypothetical protein
MSSRTTNAEGVAPLLGIELDAPGGLGHGAGEDGVERGQVEVGPLEEERALLRKPQGEAGVDVEL